MHNSPASLPDVSVVLPCAGFATRFGAPYAKELHCLAPGVTVLDRSLEPVVELAKNGLNVRVVVVFGKHKLDTVGYLARYAGIFHMVFVYQDESYEPSLDGAIRSALPMTLGPVALVLPDIVVDGPSAPGSLLAALDRTAVTGWSVVATETREPETLRQMGALALTREGGLLSVEAAVDKPADPARYNAFWGMVAASEEQAHRLPDVFNESADSPLVGAVALLAERIVNYNTAAG